MAEIAKRNTTTAASEMNLPIRTEEIVVIAKDSGTLQKIRSINERFRNP